MPSLRDDLLPSKSSRVTAKKPRTTNENTTQLEDDDVLDGTSAGGGSLGSIRLASDGEEHLDRVKQVLKNTEASLASDTRRWWALTRS
jgi:hypothetical protein